MNFIAITIENYAQFVKYIKLYKMRGYRKKLAIFELTELV